MIWNILIWIAVTAEECPKANCDGLGLDMYVCASKVDNEFLINDYGCPDDTTCLMTEVYVWYKSLLDENISDDIFKCIDSEGINIDPEIDQVKEEDVKCDSRPTGEMLEVDLHPKRCDSNKDCKLMNGELTECSCGMDGFKYCQPEWGSEVFEIFWFECDDGEIDIDYWKYYKKLYKYYAFYITAPDCASVIFEDLDFKKPDSAMMVYYGISLIIFLIV